MCTKPPIARRPPHDPLRGAMLGDVPRHREQVAPAAQAERPGADLRRQLGAVGPQVGQLPQACLLALRRRAKARALQLDDERRAQLPHRHAAQRLEGPAGLAPVLGVRLHHAPGVAVEKNDAVGRLFEQEDLQFILHRIRRQSRAARRGSARRPAARGGRSRGSPATRRSRAPRGKRAAPGSRRPRRSPAAPGRAPWRSRRA